MNIQLAIDSNNVFMRNYHMLKGMSYNGFPTGGIKGYVNSVNSLIKMYKPTHIRSVWDGKGKTFRHDLFPEYKANRPQAVEGDPTYDKDMPMQRRLARQYAKARGWNPIVAPKGYEADDVLGSLAKHFNGLTIIVSNDKDFAALVCKNIQIHHSVYGRMGPSEVESFYGVKPKQIEEYLMLSGDGIDNVPGVAGIGNKTAADLLNEYGSIERIYEFIEDFTKKRYDALLDFQDRIDLVRKLIHIDTNVPVSCAELGTSDSAELRRLNKMLGFSVPKKGI